MSDVPTEADVIGWFESEFGAQVVDVIDHEALNTAGIEPRFAGGDDPVGECIENTPGVEPTYGKAFEPDDSDRAMVKPLRVLYKERAQQRAAEYQQALQHADPERAVQLLQELKEAEADAEAVTHGVDPLVSGFVCNRCGVRDGHDPRCRAVMPVVSVELVPAVASWSAAVLTPIVVGLPQIDGVVFTDWFAIANMKPPEPTLLRRTDEKCLLVVGLLCDVHGPSEAGKTMLVVHAAAQVINGGGTVLYLDFETSGLTGELTLRDRLRLHGIPDEVMQRRFLRAELTTRLGSVSSQLRDLCITRRVGLVVIDSYAALLGAHGIDENSSDASAFYTLLRRTFTAAGCTVMAVDQVGYDESRARGFSGKKFELDVSLHMKNVQKFSTERAGWSRVSVEKDRASTLARLAGHGEAVAELHVTPLGSGLSKVELRPPSPTTLQPVSESRQAQLEKAKLRLWEHIDQRGPFRSQTDAIKRASGKTQDLRDAFKALVDEGSIAEEGDGFATVRSLDEER